MYIDEKLESLPRGAGTPAHVGDDVTAAKIDLDRVARLYRELLVALGEDPQREGLVETPRRVASWWDEFLSHPPARIDTTFEQTTSNSQLVLVKGISVWSLCEHHLLPFRLDMAIGYLPKGEVLGLSKFARIARHHASRLQLQERVTEQVSKDVARITGSGDVAVVAEGEHLCMSMRGVRTEDARTTTMAAMGRLDTDPALSARFVALAFARPTTAEVR